MSDTILTDLSACSAKSSSRDGTDSGYATGATNTPDHGSFTSHHENFEVPVVKLASGSFLRPRTTKLKVFDKEIPKHVQDRFLDLNELYEKPLCDYLSKKKIKTNPISIRLKTLGGDEDTIDYWYVVMCPEKACKRIKQFFAQPYVKSEFQPPNPSVNQPFFRIWVCSRVPRVMAADSLVEISNDYDEITSTLCGRAIRVQGRMARIGGVIRVVTIDEGDMLYAMTAGHIFEEEDTDHVMEDVQSSSEEEEDDISDCASLNEEEFELDSALGDEDDELAPKESMLDQVSQENMRGIAEADRIWTAFGCKAVTPHHNPRNKEDLDWALIKIHDPSKCYYNHLSYGSSFGGELKEVTRRSLRLEPGLDVVILSSKGNVQSGKLSGPSSLLRLGSAQKFTQTYSLQLDKGSSLGPGDCGSWVVDDTTYEVYGHVVASDMFTNVYVVPLKAVLQDIEEQFGAESVSIPSLAEVRNLFDNRNESHVVFAPVEEPGRIDSLGMDKPSSTKFLVIRNAGDTGIREPKQKNCEINTARTPNSMPRSVKYNIPWSESVTSNSRPYNEDIDFGREGEGRRLLGGVRRSENDKEEELSTWNIIDDRDRKRRFDAKIPEDDCRWTEITKDLISEEAIKKAGYEYEETEEFYYVMEYLRYEDVRQLVELSEGTKRDQRQSIREIQAARDEETSRSHSVDDFAELSVFPNSDAGWSQDKDSREADSGYASLEQSPNIRLDAQSNSSFQLEVAETSNFVSPELNAQITQNFIKQLESGSILDTTPVPPQQHRYALPPRPVHQPFPLSPPSTAPGSSPGYSPLPHEQNKGSDMHQARYPPSLSDRVPNKQSELRSTYGPLEHSSCKEEDIKEMEKVWNERQGEKEARKKLHKEDA